MFSCFSFALFFKEGENEPVEVKQWKNGEGLGRNEEGETVIRIYYMKENSFSMKR